MPDVARNLAVASISLLLVLTFSSSAFAQAGVRCERDEQGRLECFPVDENRDPWVPPPSDPDPPYTEVPLDLLEATRFVHTNDHSCRGPDWDICTDVTERHTASRFEDFWAEASTAGRAWQTSHLRDDGLFLEGGHTRNPDQAFDSNYSVFDVSFRVRRAATFSLDWSYAGMMGVIDFFIEENGESVFDYAYPMSAMDQHSIGLSAGKTYRLHHRSDAPDFDSTSYTISLTQVPEPGTALLIGLGLVGVAAGRRRRR